ncbi:MAG: TetR/AcrR family transcriptional regulator [Myxococcota bacterium]
MSKPRSSAPPRKRRSAEDARHAILEVAQKRLVEGGPEALRLQDIAAELGLSHPAILHHFGSREGLLEALAMHGLKALNDDLLPALERASSEPGSAEGILERAFETLGDRGHARLLAWLALSGRSAPDDGGEPERLVRSLADVVHARRLALAREAGRPDPDREDTDFSVLLVTVALLGDGVLGDEVRRSAGLPDDARSRRRFHGFLARLVSAHLSDV